jgi:hypothetical protein
MYKLGVFHDFIFKFLCKISMQVRVKNQYVYLMCVKEAVLNVAAIFSICVVTLP